MSFNTPTATARIFAFSMAVLLLFTTALRADEPSPLEITVGIPSNSDDQDYLSTLPVQPDLPCLIHIKNLSTQVVTLPNFSRGFAPITIKTASTWVSGPKFIAPPAQSENLVIKPGQTVIASRDLDSLMRFQMFGTYAVQYTLEADYTFFPLTSTDTPPSSYTSHHITESGSFDLPVTISQSTLGWPIILGSLVAVVIVVLAVAFHLLTRIPKPKNTTWTTEFSLSDSLEKDKE